MKIALINPPYNIIRQSYGSKSKIKYGNMPPLGIGYIAAVLIGLGHTPTIIDAAASGYSIDETLARLREFAPDVIGITTLTASADAAYALAAKIKENFRLPLILGGAHALTFPEDILKECPAVDITVFGEGETVIGHLIQALKDGSDLSVVQGICYRDAKGAVIKTAMGPYADDLDTYPSPAWQLYDFSLYRSMPGQYRTLPMASYLTSRGCPWRCTFCFQAVNKSFKYRRYSPERVVSDLEILHNNFGINEIMLWDDTFTVNPEWIEKFCTLLSARKLNMTWSCYGRVNTVTRPMLKMMKDAGCWNIFYGYETGVAELLVKIKKGITLEQSLNAAKWSHELGLETRGSFMLALPGETPEMAKQTVEFAIKLDPTYAQFLPVYPEYGTELYEQALKEGKITRNQKWGGRTKAAYVPDGYASAKEVEDMIRYAYLRFYLRPAYFLKQIRKINSFAVLKSYFDGLLFVLGIIFK